MPELYAVKLSPGTKVQIHATIPEGADRTSINLQYGPYTNDEPAEGDTVAMHLDIRHESGSVVVNDFEVDGWGEEESNDFAGVKPGEPFLVEIKVTDESYVIQINGSNVGEFNHRVPVEQVTHMLVFHDVTVNSVSADDQKLVAQH